MSRCRFEILLARAKILWQSLLGFHRLLHNSFSRALQAFDLFDSSGSKLCNACQIACCHARASGLSVILEKLSKEILRRKISRKL
jgi:hypothetical protein